MHLHLSIDLSIVTCEEDYVQMRKVDSSVIKPQCAKPYRSPAYPRACSNNGTKRYRVSTHKKQALFDILGKSQRAGQAPLVSRDKYHESIDCSTYQMRPKPVSPHLPFMTNFPQIRKRYKGRCFKYLSLRYYVVLDFFNVGGFPALFFSAIFEMLPVPF